MNVSQFLTAAEAEAEFDRRVQSTLVDILRLKARLRRELRRHQPDLHRDLGGEA